MKVLFIGDIVGKAGRLVLKQQLDRIVDRHQVDFVIANGENAAGGFGLTLDVANELFGLGIHVLTSGNHIWDKKEILEHLNREKRILRPDNYPPGLPGTGGGLFHSPAGTPIGVLNLEGRVFMNYLDCPFRAADRLLERLSGQASILVVDFHAEATSEKVAMGAYLDGRVSAVLGTHTHVATADNRVLPGGTAYMSDVGMTGSRDSIIGVQKEPVLERFLTQLPVRFEVAKKDPVICAALMDIDEGTGKTRSIERVFWSEDTQA